MLINIRGTSGAGKTTVVRALMAQCPHEPIYGVLGPRSPEAYKLRSAPVFIIGPYTTPCSGCDRIQPFARVPRLLEQYASKGHVVFEGLLMSTFFGDVGKMLMEAQDSAVLFLNTALETCIARVEARRAAAGNFRPFNPGGTIQKHATIMRLRERFGGRAMSVSDRDAPATIMRLLAITPDSGERVRRRGP
jgi:hypothetical protein